MKQTVDTKNIQSELLKIYKEIKKICDRHNIPCFAIGGTMLGAVRHHGFIPWDDDMDLGILVDDLQKFKTFCKKELPEPLEFKELPWAGGKIHNKNTTFIETPCAMHRENGYGIFVDIFPIIGTPNDPEERFGFLNNMLLYSFQAMIYDRYPEASTYTKSQIEEWRNSILTHNKISESERVAEFSCGHGFTNDANGVKSPVEMKFENTTILVPSTYDADLTAHYGDYMKLPPVKERYTHNSYAIVDLDKPYTRYYDKLEKLDPKFLNFLKQKHKFEGEVFLNSALFMADGNSLRRELSQIKNSKTYRMAKKLRFPLRG